MNFVLASSGAVGMTEIGQIIGDLLGGSAQIIQFALTTFPINLAVASGIGGLIIGMVRKSKRITK